MTRCPYCFLELPERTPTFACVGGCSPGPDPHREAITGAGGHSRPPVRSSAPADRRAPRPAEWTCPQCKTPTRVEICGFCHTPFPPGWYGVETTCVAMAGARYTGKSVYIGVLHKQLQQLAESRRTVVDFLDPPVRLQYQEEYEKILFESRNLITATPRMAVRGRAARPLVFMLGPAGRRSAVVVRDVAGEDLENGEFDPAWFGFFQRADAMFFLFDPLQVSSIARMLRGQIPEPGEGGGDPVTVLQNLMRLMRGSAAGPIQVPLAVVLAKVDALHELRAIQDDPLGRIMRQTGSAVLRDPGVAADFDLDDADLLDAEVRSLLATIGGQSVVHLVDEGFAQVRFFAVSALGHPAGDRQQSPLGIAPFRCLDPLKWAFELTART